MDNSSHPELITKISENIPQVEEMDADVLDGFDSISPHSHCAVWYSSLKGEGEKKKKQAVKTGNSY